MSRAAAQRTLRLLSNTLVSVDCAASKAVVRAGLNQPLELAVTWVLIPGRPMAGVTYQTFLRVTDDVGAQTGPQAFGSWRVTT